MTLNELIKELQEWQQNGLGELPIFVREYEEDGDGSERFWDVAMNNRDLTQTDNKLIFI